MQGQNTDPLVGKTVGEYTIQRILGKGAFGTVYEGVHHRLGTRVAVKVLHPQFSMDENILTRFEREARAVARINHPSIVGALTMGRLPDGRHYTVMEFVDGVSLSRYIREKKSLAPQEILEIVRGISDALAAIHDAGIVHRDLKPDNIMLNFSGIGVHVKILDFGIAKLQEAQDGHLTQTGEILGTPAYMSPEQARGEIENIGPWTDIYALGVMVYQMFSGRLPIAGRSTSDTLLKILTQEPAPLSTHVPGVAPQVEAVLKKALAKEPAHRYQGVREFFQEFSAAMQFVPAGTNTQLAQNIHQQQMPAQPSVAPGLPQSQTAPPTADVPPLPPPPDTASPGTQPAGEVVQAASVHTAAPSPSKKKKKKRKKGRNTAVIVAGIVGLVALVAAGAYFTLMREGDSTPTHDSDTETTDSEQEEPAPNKDESPTKERPALKMPTFARNLPFEPHVVLYMGVSKIVNSPLWDASQVLAAAKARVISSMTSDRDTRKALKCLGMTPEQFLKGMDFLMLVSPKRKIDSFDQGIILTKFPRARTTLVKCMKQSGVRVKNSGGVFYTRFDDTHLKIVPSGTIVAAKGKYWPLVKRGTDPLSSGDVGALFGGTLPDIALYLDFSPNRKGIREMARQMPYLSNTMKMRFRVALSIENGLDAYTIVDLDSPQAAAALKSQWDMYSRAMVLSLPQEVQQKLAPYVSKWTVTLDGNSVSSRIYVPQDALASLIETLLMKAALSGQGS